MLKVIQVPAQRTTNPPACPPWCQVEDHEDWGPGHSWHDTVELSGYPYVVNGEAYRDRLWVALRQERGNPPMIVLDGPGPAAHVAILPDGITTEPGAAVLTFDEVAELITVLQEAMARGAVTAAEGGAP